LLDEVMTHAYEIDVNIDQTSRRLRLQNLRVLMAVIDAGSMGRARRELSITQPAISRSIADLEDTFGVPLLERGPHGVQPTAFGVALRDCGLAVFDDLRQGIKEIASLADPEAGEVRIGSGGFMAASFVAAVINRLSCRYPRMTFHLVAAPPETLQAELVRRNIDVVVTRFGAMADKALHFEPLFEESFVVAAGACSPWSRRRRLKLQELVDEPWTLPLPDSVVGAMALDAFHRSGVTPPKATVWSTTPEMRISLLRTGRFLSIFPDSVLRFPAPRPELKKLPLVLPTDKVRNGIFILKQRVLSPATRSFMACAQEVGKLGKM